MKKGRITKYVVYWHVARCFNRTSNFVKNWLFMGLSIEPLYFNIMRFLTPEIFHFSVRSAVDMVSQSVMSSAEAQMARFYAGGHVTPPAVRTTPENVTWDLAR